MASPIKPGESSIARTDAISREPEQAAASDAIAPQASEDQALALLQSADVNAAALANLARSPQALKSRKVLLALAMHPRTPRHISVPLLRRMFTFDLMQLTLTPAVAGDIKRTAEDQILLRLESLSSGEKISLGRRASGRVAAELLRDADARVVSAALENGRLVEAGVVTGLMKRDAKELIFTLVSAHVKWSQRREVQIALLRSELTPLERAREFATHFSLDLLHEFVPESRRAMLTGGDERGTERNSV